MPSTRKRSGADVLSMMDDFLAVTREEPDPRATPEEFNEEQIQKALKSITSRFVHNMDLGSLMSKTGEPSVCVFGVDVPMDRFMQRVTEVHDAYMERYNPPTCSCDEKREAQAIIKSREEGQWVDMDGRRIRIGLRPTEFQNEHLNIPAPLPDTCIALNQDIDPGNVVSMHPGKVRAPVGHTRKRSKSKKMDTKPFDPKKIDGHYK